VPPSAPSKVHSGVQARQGGADGGERHDEGTLFLIAPGLILAARAGGSEALSGERVEFMAPRTGKANQKRQRGGSHDARLAAS
jgi:hypothetical protein